MRERDSHSFKHIDILNLIIAHRQKDRHRDTDRQTETDTERRIDRQRQTQRDRHTYTQTEDEVMIGEEGDIMESKGRVGAKKREFTGGDKIIIKPAVLRGSA